MNRNVQKSSMVVAGLCGCALMLGSVSLAYGLIFPPFLFRLCKHCEPSNGDTICFEWVCLSLQDCRPYWVGEVLFLDCANP